MSLLLLFWPVDNRQRPRDEHFTLGSGRRPSTRKKRIAAPALPQTGHRSRRKRRREEYELLRLGIL
jgi:hypothetical protein